MKTLLGIAVISACVIGCSESHEGHDAGDDAGSITLFDSGMRPGFDAGMMSGTDAGMMSGTDAGMMSGTDAGMMSGTDAGPPGVDCGGMMCGAGQVCCVTFSGGAAMQACTAEADCMGAVARCDGPEDCTGGQACCAMGGAGGGTGSASCGPADCMFQLCHTVADCPSGSMCCPFMGSGVCSSFGCF